MEQQVHSQQNAYIYAADPYCKILVDGKKVGELPRKPHTLAPQWNTKHQLYTSKFYYLTFSRTAQDVSELTIEVWSHVKICY